MKRIYWAAVFLLSNIIAVACYEHAHVDPKKKFFTFTSDGETEDDQSEDGSPKNDSQKEDCAIYIEKKKKCESDRKFLCEQYLTFLDLIQQHAVEHANKQVLTFDLHLTRSDLFAIKNALRNKNCHDDSCFLLTKFQTHYSWKMKLLDMITDISSKHKMLIVITVSALSCFLLLMYWVYMSRSWFFSVLKMVVLLFMLSVGQTAVRKYQEHLAHYKAIQKIGIPLACTPEEQGFMYPVWLYLKDKFSVMGDDCVLYYKAEMIEPMLKTTLIEIFTETASRWILTPLPIIFEYIGKASVALFQTLPVYFWVPAILMIYFSFIVYLLLAKGYRIRSLFLTIEPTNSVTSVTNSASATPAVMSSNEGSKVNPVRKEALANTSQTNPVLPRTTMDVTFSHLDSQESASCTPRDQIEELPGTSSKKTHLMDSEARPAKSETKTKNMFTSSSENDELPSSSKSKKTDQVHVSDQVRNSISLENLGDGLVNLSCAVAAVTADINEHMTAVGDEVPM